MVGGSNRRRSCSPTPSRRRSSSPPSSSPFPAGRTVTYRPDAASRSLEVEVEMENKESIAMPAQRASPALPSKVYDCRSSVVLVNDLLAAGIIELEGGDGKLAYCYFRARDLVTRKEGGSLGERLPVGSRVKCHCWLLDEVAKVPYLASVVWTDGSEVPREVVDKILGLPDREDMEAYHRDSRDLAWQLSTNRRVKEDRKKRGSRSRERKRSPKREKRRHKSRERGGRRDRSRERSQASSSASFWPKKEKRSQSRETSRSSRGSRSERQAKERSRSRPKLEGSKESRERKRRSRDPSPKFPVERGERGRSGGDPHRSVEELLAKNFPYRNEGRGLLEEGRRRRFSEEGATSGAMGGGKIKLPPRPRMAIGRNVFGPTGEPDLLEEMGMSVSGRGRGGKVAIGRNVFNPSTPKRRRHSGGGGGGGGLVAGDCPGLGFQGENSSFRGNRKNSRWMRWQSLCRKKPGEEGDHGGKDEEREEGETEDEDDQRSTSRQSHQGSTRSRSPHSSSTVGSQGHKVSVLTYHNEEVGVLVSPNQELRVLFHVSQVRCWARVVPPTREANHQATAVWLEGESPAEELYRTCDLATELNFHLTEYQTGRLGKLDEVAEPSRQVVVGGEVIEYISMEMGVIRLTGGEVALFHLSQVWQLVAGTWTPHKTVMSVPLAHGHLPLGTVVRLSARRLPASHHSQLKWQALVLWNLAASTPSEIEGGMYARRGLQEGTLPPAYSARYASVEARASLIRELDVLWDGWKRLAKLDLKSINPVPVVLNLLPEDWEAKVVKVIDLENGVVQINSRQAGADMSGDLGLGVTKIFAMFHIEDVYCFTGELFRSGTLPRGDIGSSGGSALLSSLKGKSVDLTARSIVSDASCSFAGLFQIAASQILLSQMYEHVSCPILQAISVFLKPDPDAQPNLSRAPRATYLRSLPESLHKEEPATAFHLNYLLQCKLDSKALSFFTSTNQTRMQKEVNNGLAMAHFNQQRKNTSSDRSEQQKMVEELVTIDTCNSRRFTYGTWLAPPRPPVMPLFPPALPSTRVTLQLLYQQGFDTKEGVLRLELPTPSGHKVITFAFFDLSCYKFQLKAEVRTRDLASLLPLHSPPPLLAHLLLADRDSPIPYVVTALWNPTLWARELDTSASVDPLFLQKYQRLVAQITAVTAPPTQSIISSSQPTLLPTTSGLPVPIPATVKAPATPVWATQELLKSTIGKVTSIIDGNYGIAVCNMRKRRPAGAEAHRAILLFDTCDVWVGLQTAQQLDLSLSQCLAEGDYIKVKAIMVPESENRKNIRYLATSLVTGKERARVKRMTMPETEPLENLDQIHPSKINNFYAVVSAVCHGIPGDAEEECRGVSSDEEEEGEGAERVQPLPTVRLEPEVKTEPGASQQVARERIMARSLVGRASLDDWEKEREKQKLVKANECLQARRKLSYDKAAKEMLVEQMKLKNQLLWRCPECEITCGKEGMEKHVCSKAHWDRVLANYINLLDQEKPNLTLGQRS